jgi:hypothetical protein
VRALWLLAHGNDDSTQVARTVGDVVPADFTVSDLAVTFCLTSGPPPLLQNRPEPADTECRVRRFRSGWW